ncbi:glycosyltransferase [Gemmatimonas sp.]|uniref:glycosyltransferase n=1 Tax=Gemmatimonas sp. TaxID=1962908 RepID=UPI003982E556
MTAPTVPGDIAALVRALPEIYQSIYGHPEYAVSAARGCEDRLTYLVAIHDQLRAALGRPVRVLDLGCAQGYFSIALAKRGASVLGVDFASQNIDLCNALATEHPEADLRFVHGTVEEVIGTTSPDAVDMVLGLSVFHHLVHAHGVPAVRALLSFLGARVAVGVFEMAMATEPLYWGPSQPVDPRELLTGWLYMATSSHCTTHLSSVARPLIVAQGHATDGGFWDSTPPLAAGLGLADGMRCVPSVQLNANEHPRFHVFISESASPLGAVQEAEGGVEPSIRLFLDAQLESDDVVLDLSPGDGFVALSAATATVAPSVYCATSDSDARRHLERAARAASVGLTLIDSGATITESSLQELRRDVQQGGRIFVHSTADDVAAWGARLASVVASGRLIAWCVGGQGSDSSRRRALGMLRSFGFLPMMLVDRDGDLELCEADEHADAWIAIHQPTEEPMRERLVGDDPVTNHAMHSAVMSDTPALNFIAPFCRTGYGIAGAHLLHAMIGLNADVSYFPLGAVDPSILPFPELESALAAQDRFDTTVASVRLSQQFDLALHVGKGPRIGFPIFELDRFDQRALHHLKSQDRLLVCSEWARGVLLQNGIWKMPVDIVPLGVDRSIFHEKLPTGTTVDTQFLSVGKLEPRKGQLELLRAFESAFTPSDPVRLTFICANPFLTEKEMEARCKPFRTSKLARRITLVTRSYATQSEVARAMAMSDCGVFISRAEGWNLEALEMLSCGRQVIATNYSAHTEFLNGSNARLVEIDGVQQARADALGAWAAWDTRQHDALVEQLCAVHAARRSGPLPLNEAGLDTAKQFSWTSAARSLLAAVQRV